MDYSCPMLAGDLILNINFRLEKSNSKHNVEVVFQEKSGKCHKIMNVKQVGNKIFLVESSHV